MTYLAPSATPTRTITSPASGRALASLPLLAVVLGLLLLAACVTGAVGATPVALVLAAGLTGWLTVASTTGSGM